MLVQGFSCIGLVSLLSWLQHGWGIVGCAPLGLGVAQCLMQQERGLQAAELLPSAQELLNAFNKRYLVWPFGLIEPFHLFYCFTPLYPIFEVPRK